MCRNECRQAARFAAEKGIKLALAHTTEMCSCRHSHFALSLRERSSAIMIRRRNIFKSAFVVIVRRMRFIPLMLNSSKCMEMAYIVSKTTVMSVTWLPLNSSKGIECAGTRYPAEPSRVSGKPPKPKHNTAPKHSGHSDNELEYRDDGVWERNLHG